MKLQKQPNRWSCLLTSFAMALDIDQYELMHEIGHDGSQFLWPELPEPQRRRSFHIQELVDCCIHRGYIPFPIEATPCSTPSLPSTFEMIDNILLQSIKSKSITVVQLEALYGMLKDVREYIYQVVMPDDRLDHYLSNYIGVLIGESLQGNPHAVAWDKESIFDPAGQILPKTDFIIETFWAIFPMARPATLDDHII